jgi:hypothetical protein
VPPPNSPETTKLFGIPVEVIGKAPRSFLICEDESGEGVRVYLSQGCSTESPPQP